MSAFEESAPHRDQIEPPKDDEGQDNDRRDAWNQNQNVRRSEQVELYIEQVDPTRQTNCKDHSTDYKRPPPN